VIRVAAPLSFVDGLDLHYSTQRLGAFHVERDEECPASAGKAWRASRAMRALASSWSPLLGAA
jgi:hypothetical protein